MRRKNLTKKFNSLKRLLLILTLLFPFLLPLYPQLTERYFDKVSIDDIKRQPHLVIFLSFAGNASGSSLLARKWLY